MCIRDRFAVADQPYLKSQSVIKLIDKVLENKGNMKSVFSLRCGDTVGNPCVFHSSLIPQLLSLEGDKGGRSVAKKYDCVYVDIADERELTEDVYKRQALNAYTHGAIAESVRHIVGVQFRNVATVGGSIWGRFGFSDVMTIFRALGAKVQLHKAGIMDLDEFAALPRTTRDVLVSVIVPKNAKGVVYLSQRNQSTDFPVLTCDCLLYTSRCV